MLASERAGAPPLVIAHRGASGYLPEHTLAAKALAHAQRADYLEQDLVASRDGRVVVCHDLYLERVTNVAEAFPGRQRDDGHFYAIDFDWAEISGLSVLGQDTPTDSSVVAAPAAGSEPLRLVTLEEELEFIADLNGSSDHHAGIYPELKHPQWHSEHGFDLSSAVLRVLADYGYQSADDRVFVQCVDAAELRRLKFELGTTLQLTQLLGRDSNPQLLTAQGLAAIAEYAAAIGPNYRLLLVEAGSEEPVAAPAVHLAHEAGLLLHPYTFNDKELPGYAVDLERLLALAYATLRPDAVFCDFPDIAVRLRESAHRER